MVVAAEVVVEVVVVVVVVAAAPAAAVALLLMVAFDATAVDEPLILGVAVKGEGGGGGDVEMGEVRLGLLYVPAQQIRSKSPEI